MTTPQRDTDTDTRTHTRTWKTIQSVRTGFALTPHSNIGNDYIGNPFNGNSYRESLYKDSLYRDSLYRECLYRESLYRDPPHIGKSCNGAFPFFKPGAWLQIDGGVGRLEK